DVHEDDVRTTLAGEAGRLRAVGGLRDDGHVWRRLEDRAQPRPDQVLVVRDDDADHSGPPPAGSRASSTNPPAGPGPAVSRPSHAATRSRSPSSPKPVPRRREVPGPSSLTRTR